MTAIVLLAGRLLAAPADDLLPVKAQPGDWPWWRGPTLDGKSADAGAPVRWSRTENVAWVADVPGRGHATPIVVGGRVIVATCDDDGPEQVLIAYDRRSGKELWTAVCHEGGLEHRHEKNSNASSTPASDGERVFVPFLNRDSIRVTATDLEGKVLWQKDAGKFETMHGYSSSALLWKSAVIVVGDSSAGGFITALGRKTGEVLWRTPRGDVHSFSSPAVAVVAGRPQLFLNGAEKVASYDPDTGSPLWHVKGPTQIMACTMATGEDIVFASGGYPEKELLCIRAGGAGDVTATHVAWRAKRGVTYVPSPIFHRGRLYVVNDQGIVTCFDGANGEELWKDRLDGGFSASPTLAGGLFYVPNEAGVTFVFKDSGKLEVVARNDLGDGGFASPVICGGQVFIRTLHKLYAIGDARIGR